MILGIFYCILIGLFFLIGIIAFKNGKYDEKKSLFTFSLAFITMFGLIIFDILPEIIETKNILYIIPIIIGFLILILLDKLIPHHHEHKNHDKHEHEMHLTHIGTITIIALGIHNLLEGLTLYNLTIQDSLAGLLMMISISFHNIPLGLQIGNSLREKKYNYILITFLVLSSLMGALIIIIFNNLNTQIINILLSLTLGMLIYILIFELFNEIKDSLKKSEVIYGIIVGIVILLITLLV